MTFCGGVFCSLTFLQLMVEFGEISVPVPVSRNPFSGGPAMRRPSVGIVFLALFGILFLSANNAQAGDRGSYSRTSVRYSATVSAGWSGGPQYYHNDVRYVSYERRHCDPPPRPVIVYVQPEPCPPPVVYVRPDPCPQTYYPGRIYYRRVQEVRVCSAPDMVWVYPECGAPYIEHRPVIRGRQYYRDLYAGRRCDDYNRY